MAAEPGGALANTVYAGRRNSCLPTAVRGGGRWEDARRSGAEVRSGQGIFMHLCTPCLLI